jgi:heme exporter protein A
MLEANELTCIRDDWTLFSGLSFRLEPSQALLIEGHNGSGKSSLLSLLCGLRSPDAGQIFWDGQDIEHNRVEYNQHIAYIGHKDGIKLDLTARENLAIAQTLGAADTGVEVRDALATMELAGYEDSPARNLSAGQRRRVGLARLLLNRCRLWILDEPFTSLDRRGIALVERLIADHLGNDGMLAMTSHHVVNLDSANVRRIDLSSAS